MITKRLSDAAFVVLGAAVVGVTYGYGNFVKVRIGPVFALEALFAAWLALAVTASFFGRRGLRGRGAAPSLPKILLPTMAFFVWGLLLLATDLIFHRSEIPDGRTLMRVLQHSIIFVYPMLWMSAGVWAALTNDKHAKWLAFAALAASVGNNNWAIGPLLVVPMMLCLLWVFQKKDLRYGFAFMALALVVFYPFWLMWARGSGFQRMTLGMLFLMMAAVPFLAGRTQLKVALRCWGIALSVLVAGFVALSYYTAQPLNETFKESFQHVEDRPAGGEVFPIQLHSRRMWWSDTLHEWRKNPVFGVGFVPELPVWLYKEAGMRNNWETAMTYDRLPGRAPVSGPHNSYLSVLARMGLLGLGLLLAIYLVWFRAVRTWAWKAKPLQVSLAQLLIVIIPINGALYALLNVGLEGPHNCMAMWLFAGIGLASSRYAR